MPSSHIISYTARRSKAKATLERRRSSSPGCALNQLVDLLLMGLHSQGLAFGEGTGDKVPGLCRIMEMPSIGSSRTACSNTK